MIEHNVYFWLDDGVSEARRADFEASMTQLLSSAHLARGSWGRPAPIEIRPVSEMSWDYALHTSFESLADHDAYQATCPVHQSFIAQNKALWKRVMVLDSQT